MALAGRLEVRRDVVSLASLLNALSTRGSGRRGGSDGETTSTVRAWAGTGVNCVVQESLVCR